VVIKHLDKDLGLKQNAPEFDNHGFAQRYGGLYGYPSINERLSGNRFIWRKAGYQMTMWLDQ
jgi:hypothetical protein